MGNARLRLLGPVNAGLDLPDAAGQRLLALVKPGDLGGLAGEFAAGLVAEFDVAPHRHPVADIVGEQRQPVVVTPFVEQLGLGVEEFRHFLPEQEPCDAVFAHELFSPRPRSSTPAIASSTLATAGKPSWPQPC